MNLSAKIVFMSSGCSQDCVRCQKPVSNGNGLIQRRVRTYQVRTKQKKLHVIVEYVNNLPPPRLMYSVNYNKKQFDKDQKIVTSDLKVLMKSEI